ncbi:Spindly-like protein spdl-1 [Caenorhabditis elegans]|uniref:Spindly-like protein spdl-1 n=1 Tax=Caenorhabditis elegans TaxID=6239 RepID=SPDL1_CAEEL|nr:Spindly-like protein spdl-1 [Caenorhabditis elegans]Q17695.1 RecName: Full=Spindly-like protein spdl-1 [Caenorhabditis elegans]CCD61463.1 Spindly-like protein spdl-1 [Caenorhabditis elegans]|eukprot:NP_495637.1 Spindly-like protein spdl-1 [Caenorhabditis elegans]
MPDDEEKLQLLADVERLKKILRQKDEMLEEMEDDLKNQGKPCSSKLSLEERAQELSEQLRDLHVEMDGKNATILDRDALIDSLRSEIDKLEKINKEFANGSVIPEHDDSNSFGESEMLRISEDCQKYKETATALYERNAELEKEAVNLKDEIESMMDHIRDLKNHMETRDEEIARLEGELFDERNSHEGKLAARGNSMFSEVIDAERKVEEDLKVLHGENRALKGMVKRLRMEVEEVEERLRSSTKRFNVTRMTTSDIDVKEMRRLRDRVCHLETERVHLWERMFIKMRSIPKREVGALITGYFKSFELSIASVKGGFDGLMKDNEKYVTIIRGLQQEVENLKADIVQLQFDNKCAHRKAAPVVNKDFEHPLLAAPLKTLNNGRPSFFIKPKNVEPMPQLGHSLSSIAVTPQKPAAKFTTRSSIKDDTSEWAERRMKAQAEKKLATPTPRYNYIKLSEPVPKFKPAVLQMPSTSETKEN